MTTGQPDYWRGVKSDIVAQTIANLSVDIAAQTLANMDVDIIAQSIGNLEIDVVAQALAELNILPANPITGAGQTPWAGLYSGDVGSVDSQQILSRTIPAGRDHYLTGGLITLDFPGPHRLRVQSGLVYDFYFWIDHALSLPFKPSSPIITNATKDLIITFYNDDEITCNVKAGFVGYDQAT